jgi:hypothetical protein
LLSELADDDETMPSKRGGGGGKGGGGRGAVAAAAVKTEMVVPGVPDISFADVAATQTHTDAAGACTALVELAERVVGVKVPPVLDGAAKLAKTTAAEKSKAASREALVKAVSLVQSSIQEVLTKSWPTPGDVVNVTYKVIGTLMHTVAEKVTVGAIKELAATDALLVQASAVGTDAIEKVVAEHAAELELKDVDKDTFDSRFKTQMERWTKVCEAGHESLADGGYPGDFEWKAYFANVAELSRAVRGSTFGTVRATLTLQETQDFLTLEEGNTGRLEKELETSKVLAAALFLSLLMHKCRCKLFDF